MLTVSFKQDSYDVMESAGQVEACLVLNCKTAVPVDVTVLASESDPVQARSK